MQMINRAGSCLAVAGLLIHSLASGAAAQARLEVGPILGYYRPVGSFSPTAVGTVLLPGRPSDKSGLALGIVGRIWTTNHAALEFHAAQARSTVAQVITPAGPRGPASVQVLIVSAQGLYEMIPVQSLRVWLSGGGGLVRHGGEAYAPYDSPTQVAAAFGVGSGLRLYGGLNAVFGLRSFVYYLEVRSNAVGTVQRGWQVDLMLQMGLTWRSSW